MPILKSEDHLYPNDLLTNEHEADAERNWWALYTKARQEKSLARELCKFKIPFYLPLIESKRVVNGRKVVSSSPLFTGYIFLFSTDDERVRALSTNRIAQSLEVDDQEQLKSDLHSVEKLIQAKVPLAVESRLAAGQRVRVKNGAFAGFEGVIIKRVRSHRLQIDVKYLQQGVSVELDDFTVEAI